MFQLKLIWLRPDQMEQPTFCENFVKKISKYFYKTVKYMSFSGFVGKFYRNYTVLSYLLERLILLCPYLYHKHVRGIQDNYKNNNNSLTIAQLFKIQQTTSLVALYFEISESAEMFENKLFPSMENIINRGKYSFCSIFPIW